MIKKIATYHEINLPEFKKNHIHKRNPAIIKNLCKNWNALKWDSQSLKKKSGNPTIDIRDYTNGNPYKLIKMNMNDYLDYWDKGLICKEKNLYLGGWRFRSESHELLKDFEIPYLFKEDMIDLLPNNFKIESLELFIGHPLVSSPIHTDSFACEAWLSMIHGEKKLRMVHPKFENNLWKGIDLFNNEIEKRLLNNGVEIYEASIKKGETIYIPPNWYHLIINTSKNIMIRKNFVSKINFFPFIRKFNEKIKKSIYPIEILKDEHINNIELLSNDNYVLKQEIENEIISLKSSIKQIELNLIKLEKINKKI